MTEVNIACIKELFQKDRYVTVWCLVSAFVYPTALCSISCWMCFSTMSVKKQ